MFGLSAPTRSVRFGMTKAVLGKIVQLPAGHSINLVQVLINAETGKSVLAAQVSGYPTNQDLPTATGLVT